MFVRIWTSCFLTVLLAPGCAEEEPLEEHSRDTDELLIQADEVSALAAATELSSDEALNHNDSWDPRGLMVSQVDYDSRAEIDPKDLDALHVPVRPGKEKFVRASAKILAENLTKNDGAAAALKRGQIAMARISGVDIVALVEVKSVSKPILDPDGAPTGNRDVTFSTLNILYGGVPPREWTMRLAEEASCGVTVPKIGTVHIAYLWGNEKGVDLEDGWSLRQVKGPQISFGGDVQATLPQIIDAIAAGKQAEQ